MKRRNYLIGVFVILIGLAGSAWLGARLTKTFVSEKSPINQTATKKARVNQNRVAANSAKAAPSATEDDREANSPAADLDNSNDGKGSSKLTQLIQQIVNPATFNGSILVIKAGKTVFNQGFGYGDKSQGIANSFQSLYYIGSVQKSITATAIMQLVDAGKLSVVDPVSKYYPIKEGIKITLRQLLTHTSGIQGRTDKPSTVMNHQQVVADIIQHTEVKNIGEWHYANDNYSLLAGIVEKVSGEGYSEYIRDRIIAPAGLSHTGFYDTFNSALFHANPYKKVGSDSYQLDALTDGNLSQEFGAGNMYMTTGDLYKFNQALLSGKLVSAASLKEMQVPGNSKNSYGFGMYMQEGSKYSHGVLGSYNTLVLTSLDGKDAVVIMANEKPEFDILKAAGAIETAKL